MSFGWSAGDIVAAISLVNKITQSIRSVGGSREHFQELESELKALSRALHEISDLASMPGQIPEIVALKFAACLCEETLKSFYEKIKPFDESLGMSSKISKLKATPRMVRWELLVKKDIPELRSYLVAHVGSLNLRLNATLLKVTTKSLANANVDHRAQQHFNETIQEQLNTETQSVFERISLISHEDIVPRLDSLLAVATKVWNSQSELMEIFSKALENFPPPDLRHTWAQAPIKLEDALGRTIPIPSEYDWDKVEAVIQAHFKHGPGHSKVRSGEYELYSSFFSDTNPIKATNFFAVPGMSITMSFIIGQYCGSERCPRLGCTSSKFERRNVGAPVTICLECHSWFRISRTPLAKPLKPAAIGDINTDWSMSTDPKFWSKPKAISQTDRKSYKNVSIYITELPPTPRQFRVKHHRTREADIEISQYSNPGRPQTYQMPYIPQVSLYARPETMDLADKRLRTLTNVDETVSSTPDLFSYSLANNAMIAETLEQALAARDDPDFQDESSAISQWFRVLSEAEQTAALYAFLQQMTPRQIHCAIYVLKEMAYYR